MAQDNRQRHGRVTQCLGLQKQPNDWIGDDEYNVTEAPVGTIVERREHRDAGFSDRTNAIPKIGPLINKIASLGIALAADEQETADTSREILVRDDQ